ncbi:TIR domain-containing protein [Chryseobacterium sp. 22458]|uniref:TIR domain-containing protein n=1 Tax=Chryseobacterium sp. 22458 TaxID=3453921 RepID=UPI003F86C49A
MTLEEYAIKQIGLPESNRLKYEVLLPSSIEIGKLICAYANTDGGLLVLGVLNKNNIISIKGLSDDFQVEIVVKNSMVKIFPALKIERGFITYEGKKLYVLKVEKASEIVTFNDIQYEISYKAIKKVASQKVSNYNIKSTEEIMPYADKLDTILKFLLDNPKRINVNKYTIREVLDNEISLSEAEQLIEKLKESKYVKSYNNKYIGISIDTAMFLENGGFSGKGLNSLQSSPKNIFVSYSWKQKETASKLYNFLKVKGYNPSMDDHNLAYKDKISTFMESIRACDYAVLIISDDYLKSLNCMTEVLHILNERESYSKILPIRHENVKIFNGNDRIKYIHFWKTQVEESTALIENLDRISTIEESKKLKIASRIYQDIGDFLNTIADMITFTIEKEEEVSYHNLLDYMEKE